MRRLLKLRGTDYMLLLRAGICTVAVRVGLWIFSFRTVRRLAMCRCKPGRTRYSVEQIVWAVRAISRYVPEATCLTQALVVQRLLTMSGFPHWLRLGVAKDPVRGFESHAWVECDGRVVIGESADASVANLFTPIAVWEG